LLKKGEAKNIKQEIIINKYVEAPIKVGAKIGTIKIYDGNNLIKTVSLTSNQNVKKSNIFDNLRKVYKSWIERN
jgi:Penicillin-binding protein 5, C-terminal domain.